MNNFAIFCDFSSHCHSITTGSHCCTKQPFSRMGFFQTCLFFCRVKLQVHTHTYTQAASLFSIGFPRIDFPHLASRSHLGACFFLFFFFFHFVHFQYCCFPLFSFLVLRSLLHPRRNPGTHTHTHIQRGSVQVCRKRENFEAYRPAPICAFFVVLFFYCWPTLEYKIFPDVDHGTSCSWHRDTFCSAQLWPAMCSVGRGRGNVIIIFNCHDII